ncbi:ArsR/SmtB family transcription factor [Natrinema salsiterrestre]|uniref:Helix-turn-helix domain-containing protein n=1 Tax=Natrinema salsiterrestre TaxID=2950540 RepID=A0A9Q4L5Z2_9EURY|nr:helix-turn-helix domain-containing protein [Natrinema salsiterrestre]MDF9748237.1 helix-turn-helix domain-containing protein [Natrinema salsiterrestre]
MDRDNEELRSIASLLADECTQTILIETATEPMSAEELSEVCEVSPQTIYRRLDDLSEHDLIEEDLQPDADGHHYKVYTATLDRVVVDLTTDGFELSLSRRDRMADRFTQFVNEVRDR